MSRIHGGGPYGAFVRAQAARHGVPPRLAAAVILVESRGKAHARSPKGAAGLMQLMPATARAMGVRNRFAPHQNIAGGIRYLGQMLRAFHGNQTLALAAYNAGPGNVRKHRGVPPFAETRRYVARVRTAMA